MGYHCDKMYIGPAIKITPVKKLVPVELDACSDDSCVNSRVVQRTNFCAECGSPVLRRTIQKSREVSFHDFADKDGEYSEWYETLFHPPHDTDNIWLPNRKLDGLVAFAKTIDERTITVSDTFGENRQRQLESFKAHYADMFEDMREYGLTVEVFYVIKTYGY